MIPLHPVPPSGSQLPHLPLVRVKTSGVVRGVITADHYIGVYTHFMGNRTLPCIGDECPGCVAEKARRWEGYLSVWTVAPSKHLIVALTPGAAGAMLETARDPNHLRGELITVERTGSRPNSPLRAKCEPTDFAPTHLPPAPDLLRHMYRIWGADESLLPTDTERIAAPIVERAAQIDEKADA